MGDEQIKQKIEDVVQEHVAVVVAEHKKQTLVDRLLRLGGIVGAISTCVTIVWAVGRFMFVAGGMWLQYKEDRMTVAATAHKSDSTLNVCMQLDRELLEYQVSNNQVHVVYDKIALRDTLLSLNERNILRNDENKNIVSK